MKVTDPESQAKVPGPWKVGSEPQKVGTNSELAAGIFSPINPPNGVREGDESQVVVRKGIAEAGKFVDYE